MENEQFRADVGKVHADNNTQTLILNVSANGLHILTLTIPSLSIYFCSISTIQVEMEIHSSPIFTKPKFKQLGKFCTPSIISIFHI